MTTTGIYLTKFYSEQHHGLQLPPTAIPRNSRQHRRAHWPTTSSTLSGCRCTRFPRNHRSKPYSVPRDPLRCSLCQLLTFFCSETCLCVSHSQAWIGHWSSRWVSRTRAAPESLIQGVDPPDIIEADWEPDQYIDGAIPHLAVALRRITIFTRLALVTFWGFGCFQCPPLRSFKSFIRIIQSNVNLVSFFDRYVGR